MMEHIPRTIRDFRRLDRWIHIGLTDDKIFSKLKRKEWRSEVFTLAGQLHCAICIQPITLRSCLECGQILAGEHHGLLTTNFG